MIKQYNLGNYNLGLRLIIRNLTEAKKRLARRYVRVIFRFLGYSLKLEFQFRNHIANGL